jgi:hypothetical protein
MNRYVSWTLMGVIGIMFVVIGIEGSLGKVLGCILTPSEVVINS